MDNFDSISNHKKSKKQRHNDYVQDDSSQDDYEENENEQEDSSQGEYEEDKYEQDEYELAAYKHHFQYDQDNTVDITSDLLKLIIDEDINVSIICGGSKTRWMPVLDYDKHWNIPWNRSEFYYDYNINLEEEEEKEKYYSIDFRELFGYDSQMYICKLFSLDQLTDIINDMGVYQNLKYVGELYGIGSDLVNQIRSKKYRDRLKIRIAKNPKAMLDYSYDEIDALIKKMKKERMNMTKFCRIHNLVYSTFRIHWMHNIKKNKIVLV